MLLRCAASMKKFTKNILSATKIWYLFIGDGADALGLHKGFLKRKQSLSFFCAGLYDEMHV